jgi:hypothetical protein
MKQPIPFVAPILFLALPFAPGTRQPQDRTDSSPTYIQGISKSVSVAYKQSSSLPTWNLKYRSGSFQWRNDQWLKAVFAADTSRAIGIPPIISILPGQIRTISFDPQARKQSEITERRSRSGCAYALGRLPNGAPPASEGFIIWAASPTIVPRAAERLNERHPIEIAWSEDGTEREVIITVNHCEYAAFVANLQWFTGQRWPEVERRIH